MRIYLSIITLFISTTMVSACGIKGPLYLPDAAQPVKKAARKPNPDQPVSAPAPIQTEPDTPFPDTIETSE